MQVVARNPFYGKKHLYAVNVQREFNYYEGEIVATPKWVDYDAIAITTGDKKYPVRIIAKEHIVEIDGKVSKQKVNLPAVKTFTITGSKGDVYTVNIGEKHSDCTCAAFQFRRSCKHIKEANERLLDL